jgi:hypothetical protein
MLKQMAGNCATAGRVTHLVMGASGIYTDPVRGALLEVGGLTEAMLINPVHARALKGHKTGARDWARLRHDYNFGRGRSALQLKPGRDSRRHGAGRRHY